MRLLLSLIIAALPLCAERVKKIERHPTTPQNDSKPNSDSVPEVIAVSGQLQRVVILRFKYHTDLLAGLQQAVAREKIKNAVILAGAGSVRDYHVHTVTNRDFPSENTYVKDSQGADIVSINGYVMNGKVHPHMTLANDDHAFGGHIEPGTTVFTFAIVTLGVLNDDLDLSRFDDKTVR